MIHAIFSDAVASCRRMIFVAVASCRRSIEWSCSRNPDGGFVGREQASRSSGIGHLPEPREACSRPTFCALILILLLTPYSSGEEPGAMILVQGASGTAEYAEQFDAATERWLEIADTLKMQVTRIGNDESEANDRDTLKASLDSIDKTAETPLWIVFIGHGTSYREISKFNLRGPDVEAKEFKLWLAPLDRLTVIVNCSSSSGPFLKELAGQNRIVVTATKSGAELNYSRFAVFMSLAISDQRSDLDHDDQVSLLEAFLTASKNVQSFYDEESRLATEQALLDDNGDGFGTPASFFKGILAAQAAKGGKKTDGQRAHQLILVKDQDRIALTSEQLRKREQLELQIEELRTQKSNLGEDAYYEQLEKLMVDLARNGN